MTSNAIPKGVMENMANRPFLYILLRWSNNITPAVKYIQILSSEKEQTTFPALFHIAKRGCPETSRTAPSILTLHAGFYFSSRRKE
jgi:hypothetical protein